MGAENLNSNKNLSAIICMYISCYRERTSS
jgi:hypothetical protein